MAYRKQDWKPFDESLSMEENAIRGGIVTAERANYIENGIEAIDKELTSAAIKLGKAVTEEDLQNYLAGKELVVKYSCDFKNKVAGSVLENPHIIRRTADTVIIDPSVKRGEPTQSEIDRLKDLDNQTYFIQNKTKDNIVQAIVSFDLITDIDRRFPELFSSYGANTPEQKVTAAKKIVSQISVNAWGYGSGPSGNKLDLKRYFNNVIESGGASTTNGKVTKLSLPTTSSNTISAMLGQDGIVSAVIYAPSSDGVTPSVVNLDYISLEYILKIKMSDVYATKAELPKNDQEMLLKDLLDATNFNEYSANVMDRITVRRSNNVVQICGTLTTALNKDIPAGELSIFASGKALPSWAKPRKQLVVTAHQGSGTAKFMTRVTPEGDIMLGRYSDASTTNMLPITAGRWLPINIIYIV